MRSFYLNPIIALSLALLTSIASVSYASQEDLEVVATVPDIGFFTVGDEVPITIMVTNLSNETRYFNITAWFRPDKLSDSFQGDVYMNLTQIDAHTSLIVQHKFLARSPDLWWLIVDTSGFRGTDYRGDAIGGDKSIPLYIHPSSDRDTRILASSTRELAELGEKNAEASQNNTYLAVGLATISIAGTYCVNRILEVKRQKDILARENEKEEEFKDKMKNLAANELGRLHGYLMKIEKVIEDSHQNSITIDSNHDDFKSAKEMMEYSFNYPRMPMEVKSRAFEEQTLDALESTYFKINNFREGTKNAKDQMIHEFQSGRYESYTFDIAKVKLLLQQIDNVNEILRKKQIAVDKNHSTTDRQTESNFERRLAFLGIWYGAFIAIGASVLSTGMALGYGVLPIFHDYIQKKAPDTDFKFLDSLLQLSGVLQVAGIFMIAFVLLIAYVRLYRR